MGLGDVVSARDDLPLALSVVALVPVVFGSALPPLAVIRGHDDTGGHVAAGIGQAAALAGLLVGAVMAVSGSATVGMIGAVSVITYACLYLHAREVQP